MKIWSISSEKQTYSKDVDSRSFGCAQDRFRGNDNPFNRAHPFTKFIKGRIFDFAFIEGLMAGSGDYTAAEDWPTFRHDIRRSCVTAEKLDLPLKKSWVYKSPSPPQTAWSGPAKWDAYAALKPLADMRDFDSAFFVTISGNSVFFGSSVENAVICLEALFGKEKWSFITGGPVRFPPSIFEGKAYVGSDDGFVYCVSAADGSLIWKYQPAPDGRLIPSNGNMISLWPIRTGILVDDNKAYFVASLLPWRESYLCCLDAANGSDSGWGLYKLSENKLSVQGAILASPTRLYMSQGRQNPMVCDRLSGKNLGTFGDGGDGGVYALLAPDSTLIHGRGQNHRTEGELRGFNAESRDFIVTFPGAEAMVMTENTAYLQTEEEISAFDRGCYLDGQKQINELSRRQGEIQKKIKELEKNPDEQQRGELTTELNQIKNDIAARAAAQSDCFIWKKPSTYSCELILAGEVLFAGGPDEVAAFRAADGDKLWSAPVSGRACGLAVADGRLLVSTDAGEIYCFTAAPAAKTVRAD